MARRPRGPGRPARTRGPDARERLLRAAAALFARHGYGAVSLREIGRAAGVTPAMVHYYFRDKRGLYDAMLEGAFGRVLERARQVTGLPELLEVVAGTLAAEPWIPPLVIREVLASDGAFRERFIAGYASQMARILPALIEAEKAAGRLRADLDPRLAMVSLLGMTAFPFVARPVLERVLGLRYDAPFVERLVAHTRRMFLEGAGA
jgi:AcrR family transcriptional regulator